MMKYTNALEGKTLLPDWIKADLENGKLTIEAQSSSSIGTHFIYAKQFYKKVCPDAAFPGIFYKKY